MKGYIDSAVFIEKQNAINIQISEIKKKRNILLENNGFETQIKGTQRLLDIIKYNLEIIDKYDKNLFINTVDKVLITKEEITFRLINSLELTERR